MKQINEIIPFLYSEKQSITIEENKDSYNLMFKILEYDNEVLFLFSESTYIVLNKCMIERKNLICKITKEKIIGILGFSGQIFKCDYLDEVNGKLFKFDNIFNIIINYNNFQKENAYIGITKLLTSYSSIYHYFVYETNITSINNIITNKFQFQFNENTDATCLMKKSLDKPLLLLCNIPYQGTFSLGEIKDSIFLDDIHIRYNFIILPVINNEEINVGGEGSYIFFAHPKVLNFTTTETITINFFMESYKVQTYVRLIPDLYDLECIDGEHLKKCIISIDYFTNKKSGFYYAYHLNYLN